MVFKREVTTQIDELFQLANILANIFDLDELKKMFPNELDKSYNTVMVLDKMSYDSEAREVQNETFGYFKFLGVFESN